jgi:hypothetical protein
MWARDPTRAAVKPQHPGEVNVKPVPHSCPGCCQLLPPWGSGPHVGRNRWPEGPVAVRWKGPDPVIRQTILTTLATRGEPAKSRSPHSVPRCAVPSTCRKPVELIDTGDVGWHPAAPSGCRWDAVGVAVLVTREALASDADPCVQDVAITASATDNTATTSTRPGKRGQTFRSVDELGSPRENDDTRRTISPVGPHTE